MNNCWLLLEKSEETRISKGIDKYKDETGKTYLYDSFVPNHKNLHADDFVVLRKENVIVGVGTNRHSAEEDSTKKHRRCVSCQSTDIRERKMRFPKWKCGKCAHEFHAPDESIVKVRSYTATIEGFVELDKPPSSYSHSSEKHQSMSSTSFNLFTSITTFSALCSPCSAASLSLYLSSLLSCPRISS